MADATEMKAPEGKFRVVGVDTFSGEDWVVGDYDTKNEAIDVVNKKAGEMLKMHVYDEKGKRVEQAGTF